MTKRYAFFYAAGLMMLATTFWGSWAMAVEKAIQLPISGCNT